jgi:hypothetical protein
MKRIEFKDVKLGHFFQADGKDWYKHSQRAAFNPWAGVTKRFRSADKVRPMGSGKNASGTW